MVVREGIRWGKTDFTPTSRTGGICVRKEISAAVIQRLPKYYRYLNELIEQKVERISSEKLSEMMHVTASQIRQDLNNFGGFGQQGYGYNVSLLASEIGKILGLGQVYHMIIVGAGNIGQALAKYGDFKQLGFEVCGMFDISEDIIGKQVGDLTIQSFDEIEMFLQEHRVDIAILSVPKQAAEEVAKKLEQLGVGAFWNFAPTDIYLGENTVVENVHLSESLIKVAYMMGKRQS